MRLVEEVTVVAAKFKSFQKTITIFIFLNQRQNLGIIIAIFVIISIIIIIIILAIMQLRPCEIETLLVSGCSLTLQACNIHIQILLTDLNTFPRRISWENLIKDQSIWGNLCTLQSGSCFVFIFTCLLAYQHINAYQWSEILRFGDCLLDSRAYFFLVFIIILLPYFKKIGVRVLNITFFFRLATKCGNLVGDIGEDELYAEYRKGKNLFNFLCKDYTKDCVQKEKEEL